ncbi:MAG: GNAT family N-acetyltransferase [Chloroflexi bacterium]|nr:GNAT family N-acetyltransferase [Chloroflexota bacterium]
MVEIKEIAGDSQLESSLNVIRDAFSTVAKELNLTPESAPTHPFFSTGEQLIELHKKAVFFGLYLDGEQAGFVSAEKGEDGAFFLGRLAVIPRLRHQGYGRKLVEFTLDYAKQHGGAKVALGMIDEQTILKDWYKTLGFTETGTRKFEHLPFTVCFMEYDLSAQQV